VTLFGTILDGAQIASLVALLATLVFWVVVLSRERGWARWIKQTDQGRKIRRQAGIDAPSAEVKPPKQGPWG